MPRETQTPPKNQLDPSVAWSMAQLTPNGRQIASVDGQGEQRASFQLPQIKLPEGSGAFGPWQRVAESPSLAVDVNARIAGFGEDGLTDVVVQEGTPTGSSTGPEGRSSSDALDEFLALLQSVLDAVDEVRIHPQLAKNPHLEDLQKNSRLLFLELNRPDKCPHPRPAGLNNITVNYSYPTAPIDTRSDHLLQQIRRIVLAHLDDPKLDPQFICQRVGMSRTQLYRTMKERTSTTLSKYIGSIRLQVARELLETTTLSVSEVAYQVGFNQPNYFSRAFMVEFGEQPRRVR